MGYKKKIVPESAANNKVIDAFTSCETYDQWQVCMEWWKRIGDATDVDIFDIGTIFAKMTKKLRVKL